MADVVPTQNQVENKLMTGLKAGGTGAVASALGEAVLGDLGKAGGTVVAGASVGGTEGKILAVEGTRELVYGIASGMMGGSSSQSASANRTI